MKKSSSSCCITVALWTQFALLGYATAGAADQVFLENVRIENDNPNLRFQNTFLEEPRSWTISGDINTFSIVHVSAQGAGTPVSFRLGAPDHSFHIRENGFAGMGLDWPLTNLHGLSKDGSYTFRMEDGSGSPNTWDISGGGLGFDIKDVSAGTTPFTILPEAPTNSVFVATNGSVGFGTAEPQKIVDTVVAGRLLNMRSSTASGRIVSQGQMGGLLELVDLSATADRKILRLFNRNGFARFQVLQDTSAAYSIKDMFVMNMTTGHVGIGVASPTNPLQLANGARCTPAGVWTNASSRELKQGIAPITSEQARETVRALQPVGYRYKNEPEEQYVGFIAEDVPELVATNDRKSLAPMDVVAVLTKVVQDQEEQNEQLCATLKREQARNDRLEATVNAMARRLAELEAKTKP